MKAALLVCLGLLLATAANAQRVSEQSARAAFGDTQGTLIVLDAGGSGELLRFNPTIAVHRHVPCSTFKIWNTLIGLEERLISEPDAPFYKWDGQQRDFPDWNKDLTLHEAFKVSCVPAFQELARRIGPERMTAWIERIDYGNRDLSAGIDCFWLPRPGVHNVLISAEEQTTQIRNLLTGTIAVRPESLATLRELMKVEATPRGTLYGKTGSGLRSPEAGARFDMGWFVGFLEREGKDYPFACLVLGQGLSGKDARRIVETVFKSNALL